MSDPTALASNIIALTSWASDPAVMTAIASLLTAGAAFWRSRHQRPVRRPVGRPVEQSAEQPAASPPQPPAPSLAEAYSTLHDAEEKIREELLQQLQHLQEEAERIGQDLTFFRKESATLEEAIIRCPADSCPIRGRIDTSQT